MTGDRGKNPLNAPHRMPFLPARFFALSFGMLLTFMSSSILVNSIDDLRICTI